MEFINRIIRKLKSSESAAMDIGAGDWATAVIKVACILILGVVILEGITDAATVNESDAFYDLAMTVRDQITNGYTLAGLMVLVLGASAVMHFLGFV